MSVLDQSFPTDVFTLSIFIKIGPVFRSFVFCKLMREECFLRRSLPTLVKGPMGNIFLIKQYKEYMFELAEID